MSPNQIMQGDFLSADIKKTDKEKTTAYISFKFMAWRSYLCPSKAISNDGGKQPKQS